jgi:hypothetical protein
MSRSAEKISPFSRNDKKEIHVIPAVILSGNPDFVRFLKSWIPDKEIRV